MSNTIGNLIKTLKGYNPEDLVSLEGYGESSQSWCEYEVETYKYGDHVEIKGSNELDGTEKIKTIRDLIKDLELYNKKSIVYLVAYGESRQNESTYEVSVEEDGAYIVLSGGSELDY